MAPNKPQHYPYGLLVASFTDFSPQTHIPPRSGAMPSLGGISAWISIGNTPLTEYGVEVDDDRVKCYVEVPPTPVVPLSLSSSGHSHPGTSSAGASGNGNGAHSPNHAASLQYAINWKIQDLTYTMVAVVRLLILVLQSPPHSPALFHPKLMVLEIGQHRWYSPNRENSPGERNHNKCQKYSVYRRHTCHGRLVQASTYQL